MDAGVSGRACRCLQCRRDGLVGKCELDTKSNDKMFRSERSILQLKTAGAGSICIQRKGYTKGKSQMSS